MSDPLPFDWSDDSTDPCALCVVWEDRLVDHARPVWPDGEVVTRLYRHSHAACIRAAIAFPQGVVA